MEVMRGKVGNRGFAKGIAIVAKRSFCFWGSFDVMTGKIVDPWHDLNGESIAGKILVIPSTKGSTANEDILYYASLFDTGPKAILLNRVDNITLCGSFQAKIPCLYGFNNDITRVIESGDIVTVDGENGTVILRHPQ